MTEAIRILGFAGSLRKGSYNKALLRLAEELVPDDAKLETIDLEGFPSFNEDHEQDPPAKVKEFKTKIRNADVLLIVTPEYNYSLPGVLKNAIDWGSRPYGDNAFDNKPLGMMGASIGNIGTARAQYHLRQSCVFLNMYPMNQPEVMVTFAQKKVNSSGKVIDEAVRKLVQEFMINLVQWARKWKTIGIQ
ncbi:MAG: NAD(P)H-dependent oxidoreductase [Nitrospirota bacterium]